MLGRIGIPARIAAATLLTVSGFEAVAVEYAVQIGAFKQEPAGDYLSAAESYGSVLQVDVGDGVSAYAVGPMGNRTDAETALSLLREHYPDAFIRQVQDGQIIAARAATQRPASGQRKATANRIIAGASDDLSGLSEEERNRVVYLDGVLHIKQGETFTPLHEYRRGMPQR